MALITLVLLMIAVVNLFTKPLATISGVSFSAVLFVGFELSERRIQKNRGQTHVELDRFNLAQAADLEPANVGVAAGKYYCAGEHVLRAVSPGSGDPAGETQRSGNRSAARAAAAARGNRRIRSGADQLFSTIEQLLFTKVLSIAEKEGKPVRLAVVAANDLWEAILRTAANLESSTIVVGSSAKMPITEQAREIGITWERMPEPRPRVTLEIFTPSGQEQIFYLGRMRRG